MDDPARGNVVEEQTDDNTLPRPAPERCTAAVKCDWDTGRITTRSCTTGRPLNYRGGCSTGCCDDYECPDCGHTFRIEWPD